MIINQKSGFSCYLILKMIDFLYQQIQKIYQFCLIHWFIFSKVQDLSFINSYFYGLFQISKKCIISCSSMVSIV